MLNPDINYTGVYDNYPIGQVANAINTSWDFERVLEESLFDRDQLSNGGWTSAESFLYGIQRPFGENASRVLAQNTSVSWE